MKKTLSIFFILFLPFIYLLTGCGFSNGTDDITNEYTIVEKSPRFSVSTDKFMLVYESGESIKSDSLEVTFDGVKLQTTDFFLSTDNSKPLNAKLNNDATLNGQYKTQQYQFYVCYQLDSERKIFVSQEITVTVNNKNGSTQIVYIIVAIVVIIAIGFALFLRSKYQNKNSGDSKTVKKKFYEHYETNKVEENKNVFKAEENEKKEEKANPFITSFEKKEKIDKEKNNQNDNN